MLKNDAVTELLDRGVSEVIVRENLEKKLRSGKKLRVKFGIDPTARELHIGHSVPLRKLRAFQELGHTIVFIIGDFTAMIGDPSGRNELRKPLTLEETRKNADSYLQQASKILDTKRCEVHFNSEWLGKLGIAGMYGLMSKITVQRALERDDFQKRLKENRDVSILEAVYPLLQGYDSVAINSDVEIGGTDQKFNLLMGRRVQRRYNKPEQDIMTLLLIEGTDGVRKMSKSYDNYVALQDPPNEIYGKIMSIPDDLMLKYATVLTNWPIEKIEKLRQARQANPADFPAMQVKKDLAQSITELCHDERAARVAAREFSRVFQEKGKPEEIPEKIFRGMKKCNICDLLFESGLVSSKGEARRLVTQGGVRIETEKIEDPKYIVQLGKKPLLIQVGKRKFLRVRA